MKVFCFKTASLSVLAAVCFTLMSFTNPHDVTQNLGQANEVIFVEGKMTPNGEAAIARAVVAAGRFLLKTVQYALEGTGNAVLHDASTLILGYTGDQNDAITIQIRKKALEARMASL
jgi:hypothetical protein